eukprot:TRINITY_DN46097_c0_g1_i1.p1 TRINITY_DN46097_c0_g1~~TRINITY_DN46097_c0_g1_i1.p1  ORF type:complete len:332 (-),score=38.58 TRINITY_DN46097_c0_g1_i1:12-983(-)
MKGSKATQRPRGNKRKPIDADAPARDHSDLREMLRSKARKHDEIRDAQLVPAGIFARGRASQPVAPAPFSERQFFGHMELVPSVSRPPAPRPPTPPLRAPTLKAKPPRTPKASEPAAVARSEAPAPDYSGNRFLDGITARLEAWARAAQQDSFLQRESCRLMLDSCERLLEGTAALQFQLCAEDGLRRQVEAGAISAAEKLANLASCLMHQPTAPPAADQSQQECFVDMDFEPALPVRCAVTPPRLGPDDMLFDGNLDDIFVDFSSPQGLLSPGLAATAFLDFPSSRARRRHRGKRRGLLTPPRENLFEDDQDDIFAAFDSLE